MSPKTNAFTLIELLVVIATISLLLAILMPSLDKAIYQAELAACAAHQKGIGTGVTTYAAGQRRAYPYRPTMVVRAWGRPDNVATGTAWDDRPYLIDYIGMDNLLDPLSGGIDLHPGLSNGSDNAFANYGLWFGMQFKRAGGGQGMYRMGDRWEWAGTKYDLIVTDMDAPWISYGIMGSHPDHDGVLTHHKAQQSAPEDFKTGGVLAYGTYTLSRWSNDKDWRRGLVDTNYAYQDGSVARFHDVKLNDTEENKDERMDKVPAGDVVDPDPSQEYLNVPRP